VSAGVTTPTIGLCEALDSPSIFGSLRLSQRQREPCEAIDAGARSVAIEWGRRSFKTGVQSVIGCWHCLPREEFAMYLRPGEIRRVLALATNLRQARVLIASAEVLIADSKVLKPMVESRTDTAIRFKHGVEFVAMPANAAGDRGRAASCVLLDEFAHHFDGDPDGPKSAERLLASVVPSTSQFRELGTLLVASTPAGDSNKFANLCDDIVEHPSSTTAYFFGKTWEVNPKIREEDLADERRLLGPELFSQEYEANRLSGAGAFLSPDAIEKCVSEGGDLDYVPALEFTLGIDPAMSSDTFGAVVLGFERRDPSRMVVAQVNGWQGERSDTFEAARLREDELLARVVSVCEEYRITSVATDVHKAREIRSRLGEHGITVTDVPFTGDARRAVFTALRLVIDEQRIDLPREPLLLTELRALNVKYTSQGQVVQIPRLAGKSHCDRAIALALAIAAREGPDRRVAFGELTLPRGTAAAGDGGNPLDGPDWGGSFSDPFADW